MIGVLLVIVLLLLAALLFFLVLRSGKTVPSDIKNAVSSTCTELGLIERISRLEDHAGQIRASYKCLEQMLWVPKGVF